MNRPILVVLLSKQVLLAHVLLIGALTVTGWLGWWQYESWRQTRAAAAEDLSLREPLPLLEVLGPNAPFAKQTAGQPVLLEGEWLPESSFQVANRRQSAELGSWLVTPLKIKGAEGSALLIVRGWLKDGAPPPVAPTGEASLVGWLEPPEGDPDLVDTDSTDRVIPQLRVADAVQLVSADLFGGFAFVADKGVGDYPYGVAATNPGTGELEKIQVDLLAEPGGFEGLRNLLYALEWWLFGAFAVVLWQRFVRDQVALGHDLTR
jgi:cytochrome oxidase assembly protein ShyY1